MLCNNFTEKLLGLKGVNVKNVKVFSDKVEIYVELSKKPHICPRCGRMTAYVHDYRTQSIKDIPAFGKQTVLILRKRRYRCPYCGKCFFEDNTFLPRYYRRTSRLTAYIISKLSDVRSFTGVAAEVSLSVSTAIRIFDCVDYGKPTQLPKAVSIDEFRGNTGGEKYQCILTDPINHTILDILQSRCSCHLASYFRQFDRSNTDYFISDMWSPYADISQTYFKNASHIIDKYHYIRQVVWAFEAIRKEEQKKFGRSRRIYFKHSRSLLNKQYKYLSSEQKQQVDIMLYASSRLLTAYALKEKFFDIVESHDKAAFRDWITEAQNSGIPKFEACGNTLVRWSKGILNSFDCPYTNGFTEGVNNKIKVLKRNAYGYRNFKRFRNRIIHIFNSSQQGAAQQKGAA